MSRPRCKEADALYCLSDLARLLRVNLGRLRELRDTGQMLGPDVLIPGGGHKAARWTASRVAQIQREWQAPTLNVAIERMPVKTQLEELCEQRVALRSTWASAR